MTPGARISAAIECLDQIFSGTAAEKALTGWARKSRFAGSKDRAAVRDHVFDALRNRDSYAALGGGLNGRAVMIGLARAQELPLDELFNAQGHAPAPLSDEETSVTSNSWHWDLQGWCAEKLENSHPKLAKDIASALKQRAPVDLRVNARKADREQAQAILEGEGIATLGVKIADHALRITQNPRKLKTSQAYIDGIVELQDAGSQALVNALPLGDGQRVLDYCAGGGGKSLAMAAQIDGAFYAYDASEERMKDIEQRADRAGVTINCVADNARLEPQSFDVVLCDAPCSGSGAWRRSPDAKWRLTEERLVDLLDIQSEILVSAQSFVSAGGFLCYATCSLFAEENEDQVNKFIAAFPRFKLMSHHNWTPLDDCDGFFVAVMQAQGEANQP